METLDIYAPLAGRLGISRIKDELEDLSLKHLQPAVYEQIRQFVADRKSERAEYLERVKEAITREATAAGIAIEIETRAKHFYSIYQKMRRRGKPLEEIYDLLGLRVLCDTTSQCYELLGLVHKLWMPIEGRFKDYIAMPKSNRYQSLHTTVMGFDGKIIEIQIRTHAMHQTAENGIAAHWLYKSGVLKDGEKTKELSLINKLREWQGAGRGLRGLPGRDQEGAAAGLHLRLHPQGGRGRAALRLHRHRFRLPHPHRHRRPLHRRQGGRGDHPAEGAAEEHAGRGDHDLQDRAPAPGLAALREDLQGALQDEALARAERARPDLRPQHRGPQEARRPRRPSSSRSRSRGRRRAGRRERRPSPRPRSATPARSPSGSARSATS